MRPVGGMSTAFPISICQLQYKRVGYRRICRCSERLANRFTRAYMRHNFVSRRHQTGQNEMRRTGAGMVRDIFVKMNRKCWPESQQAVEESPTQIGVREVL
ncbi:hypothetical protein ALC62_13057 [Cyphomyrmex costatus]|uniref:Uncharacterized protein n=1 Tax=Cyphomyrmex costatus TaxID=456900 RepID=A0A151IAF2_9HYME|nr:hypothetical protein ALC62_13057 [Cyphomyrmex costatus]